MIQLTERRFWRTIVSDTFHGRDILAPVAGHLSLGVDPRSLGTSVEEWQTLELSEVRLTAAGWEGEVVFVDQFGNLLTNIPDSPRWAILPRRTGTSQWVCIG